LAIGRKALSGKELGGSVVWKKLRKTLEKKALVFRQQNQTRAAFVKDNAENNSSPKQATWSVIGESAAMASA
jgi:hypothetical protein